MQHAEKQLPKPSEWNADYKIKLLEPSTSLLNITSWVLKSKWLQDWRKKKGSGRRRGINSKQSWSTEKKIWNTDLKGYHQMGKNQFWLNSLCFPVGLCVREHKKGHGLLHDYMTVNIIYWGSKKEIRKYKTFSQCIIVRTILQKVKGTQFFV